MGGYEDIPRGSSRGLLGLGLGRGRGGGAGRAGRVWTHERMYQSGLRSTVRCDERREMREESPRGCALDVPGNRFHARPRTRAAQGGRRERGN